MDPTTAPQHSTILNTIVIDDLTTPPSTYSKDSQPSSPHANILTSSPSDSNIPPSSSDSTTQLSSTNANVPASSIDANPPSSSIDANYPSSSTEANIPSSSLSRAATPSTPCPSYNATSPATSISSHPPSFESPCPTSLSPSPPLLAQAQSIPPGRTVSLQPSCSPEKVASTDLFKSSQRAVSLQTPLQPTSRDSSVNSHTRPFPAGQPLPGLARPSTWSSSVGYTPRRPRGYVRPQGAQFADSARNRDSVMSLGSIAHLQHYFARTGMLDGKGAQLAREEAQKALGSRSSSTASANPKRSVSASSTLAPSLTNTSASIRSTSDATRSVSAASSTMASASGTSVANTDLSGPLSGDELPSIDNSPPMIDGKTQSDANLQPTETSNAESPPLVVEDWMALHRTDAEPDEYTLDASSQPLENLDQSYEEFAMLPPTVSTYHPRTPDLTPPPDTISLRRQLREALHDLKTTLDAISAERSDPDGKESKSSAPMASTSNVLSDPTSEDNSMVTNSWEQVQGMQLLDVTTLAIKEAKDYYTLHEHPHRLTQITSERQLRTDLHVVLDVLRRAAARQFSGGPRSEELAMIRRWSADVENLLVREHELENYEQASRSSWTWLDDAHWRNPGDAWRREHAFLSSFLEPGETLPAWTPQSDSTTTGPGVVIQNDENVDKNRNETNELQSPHTPSPSPFLASLRSGILLCQLHNRLVKATRRPFGAIRVSDIHHDTRVPYRAATNLRFWLKAAEMRWDCRLTVPVLDVVYGRGGLQTWQLFEEAVRVWVGVARAEIAEACVARTCP